MKQIPLTRGLFALVDDKDFRRLSKFKWQAHRNPATKGFIAERFVSCWKLPNGKFRNVKTTMQSDIIGTPLKGFEIDHINRNSLDNRRRNLRICTRAENCRNRGVRSDSKLRLKGVQQRPHGKFIARIMRADGRRVSLGYFNTSTEAGKAYDDAAKLHHGAFASLNGMGG